MHAMEPAGAARARGDAARRRLLAELKRAESRAQDLAGKVRIVVHDDEAEVWSLEFSYEESCALGADLAEHARRSGTAAHLALEIRFPPLFPADPPVLCVLRPRLLGQPTEEDEDGSSTPCAATADSVPVTFGGICCLPELSLASGAWRPDLDLAGLLLDVRERFLRGGARLDMGSIREYVAPSAELNLNVTMALPTVARCVSRFPVAKLEKAAMVFPELAVVPPGRVVLPHECATEVYQRAFGMGGNGGGGAVHVEVKNLATGGRAYVGLAEAFVPQDSVVFVPSWLLRQLFLREGDEVRVRVVSLPLCAFVRLQPHSRDFYDGVGEDARLALQLALAPLPALTTGLSVPIELPLASGGAVVRRAPVFVASLEDASGAEVLAAKMPADGGILGEHEVRVDFLPAADLHESGGEYKARVEKATAESERVQAMAEAGRRRWCEAAEAAAAAAAPPPPSAAELERLGDGSQGLELCFKLPNGKQLRRRFAPNLTALDLKRFLRSLAIDSAGDAAAPPPPPWRPAPSTAESDLDLSLAHPRRALANDDTVASIGDRAVVLVVERTAAAGDGAGGGRGDAHAAARDAGADAVLYPTTLRQEAERAAESAAAAATAAAEEEVATDGWRTSATAAGGARSSSAGRPPRSGASPAPAAAAAASSRGGGSARSARLPQHPPQLPVPSGRRTPPQASRSAAAARVLSEAQLAPLGLTVAQFLELPAETREAMVAALGGSSPAAAATAAAASRPASGGSRPGSGASARAGANALRSAASAGEFAVARGRRATTTSPRAAASGASRAGLRPRTATSRSPSPSPS
eukprot:TRINITY_DN30259_c0_g1_i1.p1 TRINITY_DN30259_c0_g1~~TRINITY_DN30259_c0_g1_i1.p1  ORF type:complete len:830 (+),score=229.18 TRINITY_DN30259_c0_g1_i1:54-2492(+)